MRITYVCLTCKTMARREMPHGKGYEPQGGMVKCPKGHGPMSKERDIRPRGKYRP